LGNGNSFSEREQNLSSLACGVDYTIHIVTKSGTLFPDGTDMGRIWAEYGRNVGGLVF
jgi:uncharacterized membrane protein